MSSLNFDNIQYISTAAGFHNSDNLNFDVDVAAQTLPAGTAQFITVETPMVNSNDISQVRIQYDGLENFWRALSGYIFVSFPDRTTPDYEVGSTTYFTGGNHYLFTYIVNQAGVDVNIPAFTIRQRLNLYDAPF